MKFRTPKNEPVLSSAAIVAAIGALLAALVSLGVIQLSQDQQTAILTAAAAGLPIAAALYGRSQVTPTRDPQAMNTRGEMRDLVPDDGSQLKDDWQ